MTPQEYPSFLHARAAGGERWAAWRHKQLEDWYVDPNETGAKVTVGIGTFAASAWGLAELVEEIAQRTGYEPNLLATAGIVGLSTLATVGVCKGLGHLFRKYNL